MATSPGDPCGLTLLQEVRHDTQTLLVQKWLENGIIPWLCLAMESKATLPAPQKGPVALREA